MKDRDLATAHDRAALQACIQCELIRDDAALVDRPFRCGYDYMLASPFGA